MARAQTWLSDNGYTGIKDVSAKASCDFEAQKDGRRHVVEVKGTTGGRDSILITKNEVALHQRAHPDNLLIVVSDIELLEMRSKAAGGTVSVMENWQLDEASLTPLAYRCALSWD